MIFKRKIFFLVSLFLVRVVIAQPGTTIKAAASKKSILIGEPLELTIEANLSPDSGISFITVDTIRHFEFLDQPVFDTIHQGGGTRIRGVYKLTSFDSGRWVIPSFILSPSVKTDAIPVEVVFSPFDPSQDYHDIKDIIEVAPPKKKKWWWFLAGGVLLVAAIAVYLLRKKKPEPVHAPEIGIDPFEEAMKQLELLQEVKTDARKFHSKLTDIFRLYVFRKKGILSLQKTTTDLVLQLRDLNFTREQFDKLSLALRLSDFVKFAKYAPTGDDDRNCFEEIKKSIVTLEQTES